MEIIGFKCFNLDLENRYGCKFEVGKTYYTTGKICFGNNGNGYHFCKNMEDTFRYFNTNEGDISVCIVKGFGKIAYYEDDYNGYYDMYVSENIQILKQLKRSEIIDIALNLNEIKACRFIQTFKLNNDEIELFKEKFMNYPIIMQYIEYYQLKKDAFRIKK